MDTVLPDALENTIVRRLMGGVTFLEIGSELGLSESQVRRRRDKIRERLVAIFPVLEKSSKSSAA